MSCPENDIPAGKGDGELIGVKEKRVGVIGSEGVESSIIINNIVMGTDCVCFCLLLHLLLRRCSIVEGERSGRVVKYSNKIR